MSKSDIYHIIMRGINRQKIFIEDEDRYRFMQTIKFYKDKSDYQIFAYCLMDNHIH
jgi:putative transposase